MATIKEIIKLFEDHELTVARLLSGSKDSYVERHPDNDVVFNANVYTTEGKIWWGDLDLTKDWGKLKDIAKELGQDIYVLKEHSSEYDNEVFEKGEFTPSELSTAAYKVFDAK